MQTKRPKPGDEIEFVNRVQQGDRSGARIVEYVQPAVVVRSHGDGSVDCYVTPNTPNHRGQIDPGFDATRVKPDVPGAIGVDGWRPRSIRPGDRVALVTSYAKKGGGVLRKSDPATISEVNWDGSAVLTVTPAEGKAFVARGVRPDPGFPHDESAVARAGYEYRQAFAPAS